MANKRFVGEMDWGKPQENGQPTIVFCNQSHNIPEKQFQNDYEIWSDNERCTNL